MGNPAEANDRTPDTCGYYQIDPLVMQLQGTWEIPGF